MLDDIDLSIHLLYSIHISIVAEQAYLPPSRVLLNAAAAKVLDESRHNVLRKEIEEVATLNNCTFQKHIGILDCIWHLVFVRLWGSWVDALYQVVLEHETLVRGNDDTKEAPQDSCEPANKAQKEIKRSDGPLDIYFLL